MLAQASKIEVDARREMQMWTEKRLERKRNGFEFKFALSKNQANE